MPERGIWVAIDGIDAVGKSTQVASVAKSLRGRTSAPIVEIAEFSSFPPGLVISEILARQRFYSLHPEQKTPLADTVFLLSDMLAQYEDKISPTVVAGGVVVSDRGNISFIAYQALRIETSIGNSVVLNPFEWANNLAQQCLITPDLTVLLSVPEGEMIRRIVKRGEAAPSNEELDFLRKINKAIKKAIDVSGSDVVEMDGSLSRDEVTNSILKEITKRYKIN